MHAFQIYDAVTGGEHRREPGVVLGSSLRFARETSEERRKKEERWLSNVIREVLLLLLDILPVIVILIVIYKGCVELYVECFHRTSDAIIRFSKILEAVLAFFYVVMRLKEAINELM